MKTEAAGGEEKVPAIEKPQETSQENQQEWNRNLIERAQQEQQPEPAAEEKETMEQKEETASVEPQIQKEESTVEKTEDFQRESASENVQNQPEGSMAERASNLPGKPATENVSNLPGESTDYGMSQMELNFKTSAADSLSETSITRENPFMRTQGQRDIALEKKAAARKETILFQLNGSPIRLPRKKDGSPYYLMDMIERSGIDLKQPKGRVVLSVNGVPGSFQQRLFAGDIIRIEEEE